jgi:S1-C subfamily serine protease
MSAPDSPGVRLTGVRADSPAERAGLKAGDVIVEFDGKTVKDLYEYTAAFNAKKPGDIVNIVVLREGARVTLTATLGRRGG